MVRASGTRLLHFGILLVLSLKGCLLNPQPDDAASLPKPGGSGGSVINTGTVGLGGSTNSTPVITPSQGGHWIAGGGGTLGAADPTAGVAGTAGHADAAGVAGTAGHADAAGVAGTAGHADAAGVAGTAGHADAAGVAGHAGSGGNSPAAGDAGFAGSSGG